jgi:hypothetical protein
MVGEIYYRKILVLAQIVIMSDRSKTAGMLKHGCRESVGTHAGPPIRYLARMAWTTCYSEKSRFAPLNV